MTTVDEFSGASRSQPPTPVRVAAGSVLVGVVLHAVGYLAGLLGLPGAQDLPRVDDISRGTLITATAMMLILAMVVVCGLGTFFALRMLRGARWARTTLTVLGTLEILLSVGGVSRFPAGTPSGGPFALGLTVLTGLAAVTFLASAYRRPAEEFFAR